MNHSSMFEIICDFFLKSLVEIFFLDSFQTTKFYYIMLSALKESAQTCFYYKKVTNESSNLIF